MAPRKKRRTQARIQGEALALNVIRELGRTVFAVRRRRGLTQHALAERIGVSRQRLGDIEAGNGKGVPPADWFSLAKALGLYLRFEFGRDPQHELRDAGHLDIQELVVRVAAPAGWKPEWESRSRNRWIDVRLEDRPGRRILIVECANTLGDLGAAMRSSDDKVREAEQSGWAVGLVWVIRDTEANRQLVDRYAGLLESRFTGSSVAWLRALREGTQMPDKAGLVWSDVRATRLFARRRAS
jgi:transcriptional regulator with XRE-family HTH domain